MGHLRFAGQRYCVWQRRAAKTGYLSHRERSAPKVPGYGVTRVLNPSPGSPKHLAFAECQGDPTSPRWGEVEGDYASLTVSVL